MRRVLTFAAIAVILACSDDAAVQPADDDSEVHDPVATVLATESDCGRLQQLFDGWLEGAEGAPGTDTADEHLEWAGAADERMSALGCYDGVPGAPTGSGR